MPDYVPIQDLVIASDISDSDYIPVSDGVSTYAVTADKFKAYSTAAAEAAAERAEEAAENILVRPGTGIVLLQNLTKGALYGNLTDSMYNDSGVLITSLQNGHFLEIGVNGGEHLTIMFTGGYNRNHYFNEFNGSGTLISYSLVSAGVANVSLNANTRKIKISVWDDTLGYAIYKSDDDQTYLPIFTDRGKTNDLIRNNNLLGMYFKTTENTTVEADATYPAELVGSPATFMTLLEHGNALQIAFGGDRVVGYRTNAYGNFTILDINSQESVQQAARKVFNRSFGSLLKLEEYYGKMYDNTGSFVDVSSVNQKLVAKKIVLSGGSTIHYEETPGQYATHFYNEYDSNGTLLVNELQTSPFTKTLHEDTAYILMSIWIDSKDNLAYSPVSDTLVKIYAFGDSIIQGVASNEQGGYYYTTYGGYAGLSNTTAANVNLVNKGVATSGYVVPGNNGKTGCQMINETTMDDADVVTIALGINDFGQATSAALGDETAGVADGTISGAIRYAIEKAIEKAPKAAIVVFTPLNCWKYSSTTFTEANEYAINTPGTNGFTLQELYEVLAHWAEHYKVTLVDWTHSNPTVNIKNIKGLLLDGLHPSDAAYHKLVFGYLKAIPYFVV